jgi:hypothetical protein
MRPPVHSPKEPRPNSEVCNLCSLVKSIHFE